MVFITRVMLLYLYIATSLFHWASGDVPENVTLTLGAGLYLMSSEGTGDGYYLGCSRDTSVCSLLNMTDAHTHDGWTASDSGNGTWAFQSIVDHDWCLDAQQSDHVSANPEFTNSGGQQWTIYSWSDGLYRIYNEYWKGNLDVRGTDVFVNTKSGTSNGWEGQRWYFRSIEPQSTVTSIRTSTFAPNAKVTSTSALTVTSCLAKRSVTPELEKRDVVGSDLLSTITQTSWITATLTDSQESTQVVFSTKTITSAACQPTSINSSQPTSSRLHLSVGTLVGIVLGTLIASAIIWTVVFLIFKYCWRGLNRGTPHGHEDPVNVESA